MRRINPAKTIFLLLFALLLGACAPAPSPPASSQPDRPLPATTGALSRLTGKLMVGAQPLAGGWLEAFPASAPSLSGPPAYRSAASRADGHYQMELPPGEYYLFARGDDLFCYYGRNPVSVPASGLAGVNLALVAEDRSLPEAEPLIESGVFGRVSYRGEPHAGVTIYAYLDTTSQFKGMGYVMVGPTGPDGLFEASLPAGRYYLLARQRSSGSSVGPLRAGDFIGYYPGNPVSVGEGEVVRLAIPLLEVPEKVDQLSASLFGTTVLRGTIRDAAGKPQAGLRAILYDDPQMLNRPLYVSQPTGPDGAFVLSFPHGGTYYLAARNSIGGAPAPGELYGTWDGSADHALQIEAGQSRDGLEIVVGEMW